SRNPSTGSAFERMDGPRGSSSELRRRNTCEVTVGRCEHDAIRRLQLLQRHAKPRARCEPGPPDVAVSVGLRILEIDERDRAPFEPPFQLGGGGCGNPCTPEAERKRAGRTSHPASGPNLRPGG